MSRPSALGAVCYEPESTFGENVTTYSIRLPTIGAVDASGLMQEKLTPDRTVQLRNEITPGVNGVIGGEFSTKFFLTGLGSTANAAITLNALATLLGKVFGNAAAAFTAANTTLAGAGSASAPTTTAANGAVAGSLVRIGALNDGRGGGQFYGVVTHTTSVLTLLNAMLGGGINGDIVYNPACVFPSEAPTSNDITSLRFLLQTANLEVECHGVYPKSVTITGLNPGEEPSIEIRWGVAWWAFSTATFPSAVSVQTFPHAVVAAGSFFMNTFGTATRVVRNIRSFALTYNLSVIELKGPGGINQYQPVVGCKRGVDTVALEWVEDADANTLTPDLAGKWDGNSAFSIVYSASCADGSALGFKFPYCVPDGPKPTQAGVDNLNRIRWRMRCGSDNTKSTDRERAVMVMALA